MKRVKNRAAAVLLIAAIVTAGVGYYCFRLGLDGYKWVSFSANRTVYSGGALAYGTLLDRNGVLLAGVSDGKRVFADDKEIRKATLHTVGDGGGKIGAGALSVFASRLIGYNIITGAYSRTKTGGTVKLSIDAKLNLAAYEALGGRHGAVGVVNYRTGEIICMVSAPAYDPANPPEISDGDPEYDGVYVNRYLSSAFTPGSVFKLVTTAAAIENIDDVFDRSFTCTGSRDVGGERITCPRAHGEQTFGQALKNSCNCAYAELALELGSELLAGYADAFGITSRQSVSGVSTASGRFDMAGAGTASLAWSGIGQYNDAINPASFLRYVAAIANGGIAVDQRLTAGPRAEGKTRILDERTADTLTKMMHDNAAAYGDFPGLDICAKTGTAEVGGEGAPHSWFTGFIRNEGYPYAFIVIIENGGGGAANAGAVARAVLQKAVAQ